MSQLPDVVERFIADVLPYVRDLERAAREADEFGEENRRAAREAMLMGQRAQDAGRRAEAAQRAAMEAAAMGLPVVATDIRGCRQVVDDGNSGILVPVGDVAALVEAIARLAADPGLRGEMGRAARRRAEAEFDERAVVERVLQAYESVARRKRART